MIPTVEEDSFDEHYRWKAYFYHNPAYVSEILSPTQNKQFLRGKPSSTIVKNENGDTLQIIQYTYKNHIAHTSLPAITIGELA